MLDGVKIKMIKKQIEKKDAEIAALTKKNEDLKKENAALVDRAAEEQVKLDDAFNTANETIREYRNRILEVEKLHQKILTLAEETKKINEEYRGKYEGLIRSMKNVEEGD